MRDYVMFRLGGELHIMCDLKINSTQLVIILTSKFNNDKLLVTFTM